MLRLAGAILLLCAALHTNVLLATEKDQSDPEKCLRYYLDSYDNSVWDLATAFQTVAELYIKTLSEEKKTQIHAVLSKPPKEGTNQGMKDYAFGVIKSMRVTVRDIKDGKATLTVEIDTKEGTREKGYWKLILKNDKWFLYGNGSDVVAEEATKENVLKMYQRLETDLGWSGLLEFIERTLINKEAPKKVMDELRSRGSSGK